METTEVLAKIGLNEKQANVYLALLELGTASVQTVAQKADIKRPTAYLVLDELEQKGLVSVIPQKKALYTAESPERLISDLSRKQELLKSYLPSLLAFYNAKKEKPRVQLFSGKEGVKQVYDKIYESTEVWFFGTIQGPEEIYPEGLYTFLKKVKEKNLKVRDILVHREPELKYAREVERPPSYETRIAPKGMELFADNAIFGDSVVFFSFHPQIFATVISSKEVAQSLRTIFDMAWQSARPFVN